MRILIKNATIIDSKSPFNFSKKDILIIDGVITSISDSIKDNNAKIISKKNLHISKGWFDSSVCFGEPGFEERETIDNGLKTAALSGFTSICVNPNTNPLVDTIASVNYLKNASNSSPTKIFPISTFTKNQDGTNLCELNELHKNGAIGHFDYKSPIRNSNLLKIGLKYSKIFNGLIFSYPFDKSFNSSDEINEGEQSTNLGLQGIPKISETIQIKRDLEILKYTKGKLLIPFISCKESVDLIRNAKKENLEIYCSTPIMHLIFTDSNINDFDNQFKFTPPLRTEDDRESLKQGLIEGTIDMIASMHEPINKEIKDLEFVNSMPGSISLESMFGILNTLFPLEKTIELLTRSAKCFNINFPSITEGIKANITLFSPENDSFFSDSAIISSSKNSSFLNQKITGEVYGVINDNKFLIKN
ncbi:MAG: dihydroorotase [Flavobacteriaceae bacterium]|nr:dihydroorotase [Flavobacteriaceae bacterium]